MPPSPQHPHPKGYMYIGNWKAGLKDDNTGNAVEIHAVSNRSGIGKRSYHGQYKAGNRCGVGLLVYTDGHTYDGEWSKEGQRNGKGTIRWPDGNRYMFVGVFARDRPIANDAYTRAKNVSAPHPLV